MPPLAVISNLFTGDGLIIFLILLLLFGAKKLPELAKGLGSAVREFSKAKDEIHHEMTRAADPVQPQIEAPKYTEPHYSTNAAAPSTVPVADFHAETVQPPSAMPDLHTGLTPSQPVSSTFATPSAVTEEQQHHPV